MTNVSEWSPTAGLNTGSPPDGWPEGMARSAVNDTAREMMAAIARWYKDTNAFLVSAGTTPAYSLTTQTIYNSYDDVGTLTWLAHAASTSAPATLNVDGLGAKDLVFRDGSDLYIGDIRTNTIVAVVYNGALDRFEMLHDAGDRPGTVKTWAGQDEPPGWLFSWGQEVLRADYPYLFGVIGETYGEGDGSTTFVLPDLRGRVTAYKDDMGGFAAGRLQDQMDGDELGEDGGVESKAITTGMLPSHSHTFSDSFTTGAQSVGHTHDVSIATGGSHTHGYTLKQDNLSCNLGGANGAGGTPTPATTDSGGSHSHTNTVTGELNAAGGSFIAHTHSGSVSGTTSSVGSGSYIGVVQPTLILNGIIRT